MTLIDTSAWSAKACADHHRSGLLHTDEHLHRLAELAPDATR